MKKLAIIGAVLVLLAFVGMIDSAYVGIKSLEGSDLPCSVTHGCEEVLNSSYSRIGGYSIAWLGLIFYATISAGGMFVLFGFGRLLRLTLVPASMAMLYTFYLFYLQARVIHAFCDYCLLSALLVTLIFVSHLAAKPWKMAQ